MKNITTFFLVLLFCGSIRAAEMSVDLGKLREDLQASKDVMGENYPKALDAYVQLMEAGKPGYRILANSWVYDHIPEENWLQWHDDFTVRYGKGVHDNAVDAYYAFLNQKMANDDEFASSAAKRLSEVYDNRTLLEWLKAPTGQRRVAYAALKNKYPDVPRFDFAGASKLRARQVAKIEVFLHGREGQ